MPQFIAFNGATPTTVATVAVTTGVAIKTLLQVATPSTNRIRIKEWGISFDGSAAATPIKCELLETGSVAATVTAHTTSTVNKIDPGSPTTNMTLSTSGTGYTSSAEGSITTTRLLDVEFVAPTNQYIKTWPLGEEPIVAVSSILRIRVTTGTAVNAYCWIRWDE